jgi:hypothetical protein
MSKRFSDNDALCEVRFHKKTVDTFLRNTYLLTSPCQDDESGRNILAPLFNAPVMASSTSNSMRESVESNVCLAESARATEHLIKLVERLRDLQRLVLPTQVVEAPDGYEFVYVSCLVHNDTESVKKRRKKACRIFATLR